MTTPNPKLESWFTPARFAVLAGCLIVACFTGVIIGKEAFFFRDFAIFSYPLASFHKEAVWRGTVPLWNPYNDCGLPFLAQWNTMVFYPLSFIYLFFPLSWSLSFFCLVHLFIGALGMYWLARAWTRHNFAAAVAGLAFVFSGVLLSCLKWPNNIAALGWMPWVVLFCERARQGSWNRVGLAALIGATQMLAGAPEVILLTWGFCGMMMLVEFAGSKQNRARLLLSFVVLIALVAGLCAVQLLPFLDLLQHSQRDSGFKGSQWPMPPWGWLNFLLPVFRTFPSYHNVQAQPGQYWISTYFVPLGALLLALLAPVRQRRNPRVWFLWGLFIFCIWMALGNRGALYNVVTAVVPGISMMRFPIKFVVLAGFILPLLSAYGTASIFEASEENRSRKPVWIMASVLIAILIATIFYSELNPFRYSEAFYTTRNGLWRIFFIAASAGCIARFLKAGGHGSLLVLLLLVVADGLTHTTWENPTAPRWVYSGSAVEMHPLPKPGESRAMMSPEAAETVDHLNLKSPAEDVLASRASLYCNVNLLENIPKVDGFFALYPRETAEFQDRLYADTNLPPVGVMDFLGVTQLTVPNRWEKWSARTNEALPLITAPPSIESPGDPLEEMFQTNFNPRAVAFVDGTTLQSNPRVTITDLQWSDEKIAFGTTADKPSVVIISQSFYHCWKALVDGTERPILRANHAFQAIEVPAGAHHVVMTYRDTWFRFGAIISFISAAVVTILILPEKRRERS